MDNSRWDEVALREGDIIISTPAKSGTTWLQMICALLIFQGTDFPQPLDTMSPWVDLLTLSRGELRDRLAAQSHRRFLKTHTPLDGLPTDERVTYLCMGRDPRDVGISWDNHMNNTDFEVALAKRAAALGPDAEEPVVPPEPLPTLSERFWAWVDSPEPVVSLSAVLHHLSTFWAVRDRANVVMLHYDDLLADLPGQMRHLATRLGVEIPEQRWPGLVRAATFEHMRGNADVYAPEKEIWHEPSRFFHRGTSGQWREIVTPEDLVRYAARINELASPELSRWVHKGAIEVPSRT